MSKPWIPVSFAADLEFNPETEEHDLCSICGELYEDCPCPGPTQDDEYEYEVIGDILYAREKP